MKQAIAALCAAAAMAAHAAPGITPDNYIEIGDSVVDMLDTSGLAYSTMMLGRNDTARPHRAAFNARTPRPEPFDTPCPGGGSISGSVLDRDASGDLSVQDRFITVFQACHIDSQVVSGSSEFTVMAHRFEGETEVTELAFRFTALGTDALRWSGPANVVLRADLKNGSEEVVVTYRDLAVMRGTQATRWNFRLEMQRPPIGDHTARIDGAMTLGRAVLHLVQHEIFVLAPGGTPYAGLLAVIDTSDDRLEVEAGRRRYRYRYFDHANRSDTPDSSAQSKLHRVR